ncbi:MAG: glycosyltransferase [Bacteroidales bacterium]|nr:glycosyltransferase [Bacteroidales bacterium]
MGKILIVTPTLRNGGGVIRGLQNMLALLPKEKYEIDVLPMGYSDNNNVSLSNCNILDDNFILTSLTAVFDQTTNYKHRHKLIFSKVLLSFSNKLGKRAKFENWLFKYSAKKYQNYDKVIAYQEGLCTRFVQYINSPNKIAWIHCDYSERKKHILYSEEKIYSKFQHIICVSKFTLENFVKIYPSLSERSLHIYNILDKKYIREKALLTEDFSQNKNNSVQIVSIGRIDPVKQFHLIPKIISQMIKLGANNFKWILIGNIEDKNTYNHIEKELLKYNIDNNHFVFIGSKFNPYPYIKNSDILVSTSSSEACPFVVNEARVLGIPVVSNCYPSIYEFINDGKNGRICTIEEMPNVLSDIIANKEKLTLLKQETINDDYDNDTNIKKICNLLD